MKKKKIIILSVSALILFIISFPIIKRINFEIREHFTYKKLNNIPKDNGIPRMLIKTDSGKMILQKEKWEDASFKIVTSDKVIHEGKTKIKGRGNTTWERPKKSYALKLYEKQKLLGMSTDKKWVLLNPYNDKSLLRTDFAFHLGTIFTNLPYTPKFQQIEVIINDNFLGTYQLAEKIKLSDERVNFPGGFIIEKDRSRNPSSFKTEIAKFSFVVSDYDKTTFEKNDSKIKELVQTLENTIYTEKYHEFSKILDIPSFIDWYIINELTKNHDAKMQLSVYLCYNPITEKFYFGPIWDFDIASGNINYDNCDKTQGYWISKAEWIKQLLNSTEVQKMLKDRWNQKKTEVFNTINEYIPQRAAYINQAQEWNFKAWKIQGIKTWPQPELQGSFEKEIAYLMNWQNERYNWFDSEINKK